MSAQPAPPARRSLPLNTFYAVFGVGFFHVCYLAAIALLNKFVSPDAAGQFFLGYAVAMPVILFCGLELRGAFVADVQNRFSVGTYQALRNTMLLPAVVVLAGVCVWRWRVDANPAYLAIVAGVCAARLAWAVGEVGWGTFQRRERLDLVATAYALRGLAMLLPFAILLPVGARMRGGRGAILMDLAAWAVVLHAVGFLLVHVLFDRPRVLDRKIWRLEWSWSGVRALAWQTFPLGLVALAINLCDSFPRLLFESDGTPNGAAQLGYFGSLAYVTQAGNLIVLQACAAAANRLSWYFAHDRRAFLRLVGKLLGIALLLGAGLLIVAVFWGRPLLRIVYTRAYLGFEYEFRIIILANGLALLTNVLGTAATQMRLFWVQVPVQLVTLTATVIAGVLLIPGNQPVRGGAWTLLVRAAVQLTLYTACFVWGWRGRPPRAEAAGAAP